MTHVKVEDPAPRMAQSRAVAGSGESVDLVALVEEREGPCGGVIVR